jgi:acetate kinase
MGFTPASGVPMSTRSGDVDPGVMLALHNQAKLNVAQIHMLLNEQSGLLGISETSADMYELLRSEVTDARAAEAVELFCYQVKKSIGSLTAVLGGVDSIVFSGGMGENAPKIRKRILSGLEFLGIDVDDSSNNQGAECISTTTSSVGIHVIHTDENRVIMQQVAGILFTKQLTNKGE